MKNKTFFTMITL